MKGCENIFWMSFIRRQCKGAVTLRCATNIYGRRYLQMSAVAKRRPQGFGWGLIFYSIYGIIMDTKSFHGIIIAFIKRLQGIIMEARL